MSKKAWSGDGRSGQCSDMADVVCQRLGGVVEYGRNEGGKREWRERSSRLIERDIALHGSLVVGQESEEVVDVGSERGSTGEKSRVIGGGEDGICGILLKAEFKHAGRDISEFSPKESVTIRAELGVQGTRLTRRSSKEQQAIGYTLPNPSRLGPKLQHQQSAQP